MYEVRFRGRWSGPLERALIDLEPLGDGGDTVVTVRDFPALGALVNRIADRGLEVYSVVMIGIGVAAPAR